MWPLKRNKNAGSKAIPAAGPPQKRPIEVDPVAAYKGWTAAGQALASARAAQVADPLSNPDTTDLLRRVQRQVSVDAIHAHAQRSTHQLNIDKKLLTADLAATEYSVDHGIADAEHAKQQLQRIRTAREANSPAVAAADMSATGESYRKRYMRISYVASTLAALGLGADTFLSGWGLPMAITSGILGEIILTFLIGQIVSGQAELNRRQGLARDGEGTKIAATGVPKWASRLPWFGAAGLLAASIGINIHGVVIGTGVFGVLGVFGAFVAALCAFMSWGYTLESSATVATLLQDSDIRDGEAELADIASGSRIPRLATAPTVVVDAAPADDDSADFADFDRMLADAAQHQALLPQQTDVQPVDDVDEPAAGGVALAEREGLAEGSRLAAAEAIANRNRVLAARLELINEGDANPSKSAIAARAGVSRRTVNRHLDD